MTIYEKLRLKNLELEKENKVLRALMPALKAPCVHCGLTNMSLCKRGFPGCAQADDIMCGEDEVFRHLLERVRKKGHDFVIRPIPDNGWKLIHEGTIVTCGTFRHCVSTLNQQFGTDADASVSLVTSSKK